MLARVYTLTEDYTHAIEVYMEALELTPDNPDLLTSIGSLYIRMGDNDTAFQFLGNALSFDPKNTRAILALGSITQDKGDHDAALMKYRIAAVYNPNSAQLWNNIGMCFFGKQKFVAVCNPATSRPWLALNGRFTWIHSSGLYHSTLD